MPVGFLSDAERERLDSFPAQVVPGDLDRYFTLSRTDRRQIPGTPSMSPTKIIRPPDDHYFDFLESRYTYLRQFTPEFIDALAFRTTGYSPLLRAVDLLRQLNAQHRRVLPDKTSLDFVPAVAAVRQRQRRADEATTLLRAVRPVGASGGSAGG